VEIVIQTVTKTLCNTSGDTEEEEINSKKQSLGKCLPRLLPELSLLLTDTSQINAGQISID
jgi:hypothetical protein